VTRSLRGALCALFLFVLLWNSLYYAPYVTDDAFISFRYARNLVEGNGLVYNAGERVEGFSNFLWVLVEAGLLAARLPILSGVKLLGLASALATALLTHRLARMLWPEAPLKALLALAGVCLNTSLALWSQGGLETAFFAALLLGAVTRFEAEQRDPAARPWSALLFGLAWMTRPEAPVYALYFAARRLLPRGRAPLGRRDAVWAGGLLAVVVPYEAWGLLYYGALLPHTHAAKLGRDASLLGRSLATSQLVQFAVRQGWALPALLAVGCLGSLRNPRALPVAVWAPLAGGAIFLVYSWNDWMPRFRFVVPMLPGIFLLVGHGAVELARALRPKRAPRYAWFAVLAALYLGYARHQLHAPYFRTRPREVYRFATEARGNWYRDVPGNVGRRIFPLEQAALEVLQLAPERETVALADIGFPGYLGMNPIWDLRGLVTPAAAAFEPDGGAASEAAIDDLMARRPLFVSLPAQDQMTRRMQAFDRMLGEHPDAVLYRRVDSGSGAGVVYMRKDRPQRATRERVRRALERFPEYRPPSERP